MNTVSIILLIIGVILFILPFIIVSTGGDPDSASFLIIIDLLIWVAFFIVINITQAKYPTALDVYRGKTQLVLDYNTDGTYDSIVVWKGEDK